MPSASLLRPIAVACLLMFVASPVHAGGGKIKANGDLTLNVAFDFPPTDAEIEEIEAQLQIASVILCDATDGQVRIRRVNITDSSAAHDNADILVRAAQGRSNASGPNLGTQGSHVELMYGSISQVPTIAHELGHFLFGIGDSYAEERRWGTGAGIGPSIEASDLDPEDQTLMQRSGGASCGSFTSACPDTTYPTNTCFTPRGRACARNSDCTTPGDICYFALGTEFSVPANHDLVNGIGDGPDFPNGGQPSTAAAISLRLASTAPIQAFDSTNITTAKGTAAAWSRVEVIDSIGNAHYELSETEDEQLEHRTA